MPENATLVISLRDEASGQAQNLLRTLDKINVASGGADKSITKFEQSLAGGAQKAGLFNAEVKTTNSVLAQTRATMVTSAAAIDRYQAALARLNVTQDASGTYRQSGGRFASKAQITEQIDLTQRLAAAQAAYATASSRNDVLGPFEEKKMLNASNGVKNFGKSLDDIIARSTATRYALYSASTALSSFGLGLLALPVASAILASNYERDFATVERATLIAGKQASALKSSLIDLSTTVPVAFKDITNIAAAGAQLGVSNSGLVSFTRVVAELTATTNLSAEAAENFLGKFSQIAGVPPSKFANLASAILNVGVHTAATESQIAKLATQLVGIGRQAGFTVPQLIGLAGALASVSSVGPELARGTVTRFVQDIQKAVISGGPALEAFAKTAGVTGGAVQDAFGSDKFAGVFQKFIEGLDKVQEAGGNASGILKQIGITSVRDLPLLLNLAAGHKTLAKAIDLANEGYQNQDILAQHYAKINDTLVSKVKELGNQFAKFLNGLGSSSTGPLKTLIEQVGKVLESFGQFSSTDGGQQFLILAATIAVATGALVLFASGFAKVVAGVYAGIQAYAGIKKAIDAFTVSQEASAAASLTGTTRLRALAAFLGGPWGVALAAAAAGVLLLGDYLNSLKTPDVKFDNIVSNARVGFKQIADAGKAGNDIWGSTGIGGKNLDQQFAHFSDTLDQSQKRVRDYWAFFGNVSANTSLNNFERSLQDIGKSLGRTAQSDLPAAQNAFAQLAAQTDGTTNQLRFLLDSMPAYKDELTRQLTIAGQAATTQNLLKIAYGGVGDGALDSAGKAKILTDEIDRQRKFQSGLLEVTGLQQKQVDAYGAAYAKSIQPLTDFNSIVGQVQTSLNNAAQAAADAAGGDAKVTDFYDGASVSLQQFTDQLNANNAVQATWFQNVITIATQYGNDAASIFINAGYTAVNASILQQLVDATPEQAAAYIAAQEQAASDAAAGTGAALIAAGQLVVKGGGTIGKDTATQMGKQLLAGFSPADIMKEFNLVFAGNPATPTANTDPAKNKILALTQVPYPNISISVNADTSAFNRAIANAQIQANQFASGGAYPTGKAFGGYTGAGSKFEPAGIVHKGEFVFPKETVSRIGLSNLYSMMSGQRGAQSVAPRMGYADGGLVSGGGFAALDASSLQAILALANRPIYLYTSDRLIAETAARGNTELAYGGTA